MLQPQRHPNENELALGRAGLHPCSEAVTESDNLDADWCLDNRAGRPKQIGVFRALFPCTQILPNVPHSRLQARNCQLR